MADIKFMDISENDNPATTDSILVGNQENGVKRTTLGKIGDMFAVHGLIHLEKTTTVLKADTYAYDISAPTVDGYTFAFWLTCVPTDGWAGSAYVAEPTWSSTQLYIAYPTGSALNVNVGNSNSLHAYALYVKSSVA